MASPASISAEDIPSPQIHHFNGQLPNHQSTSALPTHKRTYQACIPCRRRKVRCDLGSVDEPHDPPCVRCRREKKDCFFTETRRKRKNDEEEAEAMAVAAAGLTTRHHDDDMDADGEHDGEVRPEDDPLKQVKRRSLTGLKSESREVKNETAAELFQSAINNPADALHLLVHAVAKTEDLARRNGLEKADIGRGPPGVGEPKSEIPPSVIDPAITGVGTRREEIAGYEEALQVWSRLRFVRAGWLTARECMLYLECWYKHFAPLTPISPPDFSAPRDHQRLLTEEPILAVTMLTITSRYMPLTAPGGKTRAFTIHEKLAAYLQNMIARMWWGQEQFGGGFCGAGMSKSWRGLRSLGCIESLLLLCDWHPRSMHFPPGDDGDELLVPGPVELDEIETAEATRNPNSGWTEPALRSDRMCSSLIGCAYTLGYELGVFDSILEKGHWDPAPQARDGPDGERASRIGRMLYIYVCQTSGRLAYPNMLPQQGQLADDQYFRMVVEEDINDGFSSIPDASENLQRAWAELTTIMRECNVTFFRSKQATLDLIRSGEHLAILDQFRPVLRGWLARFESIDVSIKSRTLLMIEYEYVRTYINSLSLQAVLEQCATPMDEKTSQSTRPDAEHHTPPALAPSKTVDLYKENAVHIAEVVDASRNLLRLVVEGLVPNEGLKHAPVRTHFRILSGAMFLLKTFALGGKESEISTSISLLDSTIKALRTNVVDDVHLTLRISDLLCGLTSSIRQKFVRLPVGRPSRAKAPMHARNNSSTQNSLHAPASKSLAHAHSLKRPRTMTPTGVSSAGFVPRSQGPLAGIVTPLVDPNDSSITIMPPPEWIYAPNNHGHFSGGDFTTMSSMYASQALASPGSNASFEPYSPLQNLAHQAHHHNQQQQQHTPNLQSPSQLPYMFPSTQSSGSGGYDWLALDLNSLQAGNSNTGGLGGGGGATSGAGSGIGGLSGPGGGGGGGGGGGAVGINGPNGAPMLGGTLAATAAVGGGGGAWGGSAWMGAFGPEISESLDVLGGLADGFDFDALGDADVSGGLTW